MRLWKFLIPLGFLFIACENEAGVPGDTSPLAEVERMLDKAEEEDSGSTRQQVAPKQKDVSAREPRTLEQPDQVLASFPPVVGKPYPNLRLFDSTGRRVSLSSFRGRKLLIEPVGVSCAACQAFSGGKRYGGFAGVTPQSGLESIDELLEKYARLRLSDSDILLVQIIFYNGKMQAPTPSDVRAWEQHFGLRRSNIKVLGATEDVRRAAYPLIPGFQLVDRNFVLRTDSAGHRPTHNLYTELLPALKRML